jgi:hypothetical protein
MTEPAMRAWADQFGALLRDKCRQMQDALVVTGWDTVSHVFIDPSDGGQWRLTYLRGDFFVSDLSDDEPTPVMLDLDALGVNR